jgi:arylsulfatase A-like enzyme
VRREPVTLLDVFPTIADVLGEVPPGLRGRSLLAPDVAAPHRALRPFLSSTRRGRQLHRWDRYLVHVRDAGTAGWRPMDAAEFERVFAPVDFAAPEPR